MIYETPIGASLKINFKEKGSFSCSNLRIGANENDIMDFAKSVNAIQTKTLDTVLRIDIHEISEEL